MGRSFRNFLADKRGATAMEYASIAVLVSIVVIGSSRAIGTQLDILYFGPLLGGFRR